MRDACAGTAGRDPEPERRRTNDSRGDYRQRRRHEGDVLARGLNTHARYNAAAAAVAAAAVLAAAAAAAAGAAAAAAQQQQQQRQRRQQQRQQRQQRRRQQQQHTHETATHLDETHKLHELEQLHQPQPLEVGRAAAAAAVIVSIRLLKPPEARRPCRAESWTRCR